MLSSNSVALMQSAFSLENTAILVECLGVRYNRLFFRRCNFFCNLHYYYMVHWWCVAESETQQQRGPGANKDVVMDSPYSDNR